MRVGGPDLSEVDRHSLMNGDGDGGGGFTEAGKPKELSLSRAGKSMLFLVEMCIIMSPP